MLHPNEDPSEISQLNGGAVTSDAALNEEMKAQEKKKQYGRFKRMVVWIDENWLKKLLVAKTSEQIRAADEIDEMLQ